MAPTLHLSSLEFPGFPFLFFLMHLFFEDSQLTSNPLCLELLIAVEGSSLKYHERFKKKKKMRDITPTECVYLPRLKQEVRDTEEKMSRKGKYKYASRRCEK